jgi:tetratricopeptide (TPR) repeat protein
MRITLAFAVLLAALPAQAQVTVSLGNGVSHDCYLAAKTVLRPRDGLASCSVALDHAMSPADRAATLVNRGVIQDALRAYAAAWADYNAALRINPNLGDAYLNRGAALMRMQKSDEGIVDIKKGMALGVSLPQIGYYDLAVAEENLGLLKEAYFDYKRAVAADPAYKPALDALKFFKVEVKAVDTKEGARP